MHDSEPGKRVVIAGGSGFLGRNLASHLNARGYAVVVLSRTASDDGRSVDSAAAEGGVRSVAWDGRAVGPWREVLDGAAGLVNLAGRSVDCIKTPDHCDEILRSRVESARALGEALRTVDQPPPVWVQMSTAHIHGDPPRAVCDEGSALGYGLAPTVGRAWEAAHAEAMLPNMRSVVLRTSFVLGRGGGAIRRLGLLARLGAGGTVGHGRQGMSWLHERDMDRLFTRGLEEPDMRGIYMATAPRPVSNAEFMRALRRAAGMPIGLPAPAWVVRLASHVVLRTDPELALYGRYCVPRRLLDEGFDFEFEEVEAALRDVMGRGSRG